MKNVKLPLLICAFCSALCINLANNDCSNIVAATDSFSFSQTVDKSKLYGICDISFEEYDEYVGYGKAYDHPDWVQGYRYKYDY